MPNTKRSAVEERPRTEARDPGWVRAFTTRWGLLRPRIRVARGLGCALLPVLLAGCEGQQPYRTSKPDPGLICNPDAEYGVPERCRTQIHERSDDYDLFFTEFTDQGLQYPGDEKDEWKNAAYQIDSTLEGLKAIADRPGVKGISLVMFVHGWEHNASHNDSNVTAMRALLRSAASLEQAGGEGHRVVGIYVGWRGKSVIEEAGFLSKLSFWDRKAAALRVAQGSPRELFNRVRSFKCARNRLGDRGPGEAGSRGNCVELAGNGSRPKVRMMMIGHSFGGWILYNAVAGSLVESLTHRADTEDPTTTNMRYADMVVLLNPAFEASRYTPLHRIATSGAAQYANYQAPILVSLTSQADLATRWAFPLGRLVNSVFESAVNDEERKATRTTMGHMEQYITHDLRTTKEKPGKCAGWRPLSETQENERMDQAQINFKAETDKRHEFWQSQPLSKDWVRTFCSGESGLSLNHVRHHENSVIWNVNTEKSVISDHNDVGNAKVSEFLRQLYQDTMPPPSFAKPLASK